MNPITNPDVAKFGSNDAASAAEARDGRREPEQPVGVGLRSQAQTDGSGALVSDAFAICQALGLSRSELVSMSVRQLNVRVRTANLGVHQTRAVKHLRRMLKNRGYAAICRTRRVEQRSYLEEQKEIIRAHIEALEADNGELATEVARIQRDFTGLLTWCAEHHMLTAEEVQSFKSPRQESK
ncbi:transcription factor MafK-like isoform X1 [Dermacentor andersoni]|uniref:transcription factor MafK-like isoform X1 n=2 Tax=Dermacentor andersoni TaxID=34620 RepID=UPI0024166C20|nr:transcription factor MafK-like isoform X1 [Dermacentor andersoni]